MVGTFFGAILGGLVVWTWTASGPPRPAEPKFVVKRDEEGRILTIEGA